MIRMTLIHTSLHGGQTANGGLVGICRMQGGIEIGSGTDCGDEKQRGDGS